MLTSDSKFRLLTAVDVFSRVALGRWVGSRLEKALATRLPRREGDRRVSGGDESRPRSCSQEPYNCGIRPPAKDFEAGREHHARRKLSLCAVQERKAIQGSRSLT